MKKNDTILLKREKSFLVIVEDDKERSFQNPDIMIRLLKIEKETKWFLTYFTPSFFYEVRFCDKENDYKFKSTILNIKYLLSFLENEGVNRLNKEKQLPVFKVKTKKEIEDDFTIEEEVVKLIEISQINLNEFYQMRTIRREEQGIQMLFSAKNHQAIDILGTPFGYAYLKNIIHRGPSGELEGKITFWEFAYLFLGIPIFTLFFRLLASILSTGPVYRGYNTSMYFFLILVAIASFIMLHSFVIGERDNMYIYVLCSDKIVWKNIWFKYLLVIASFIFTLLLCYLLTIPFSLLVYLFIFVSLFLFFPVFLYIIYFRFKLK